MNASRLPSSSLIAADASSENRSGFPAPSVRRTAWRLPDLNRDKRPDIIVGYVELPGSVYCNTRHGRRFHEIPWNDGKGTVYGLAFAEFDGDGWPDVVAARSGAPNGNWFSTKPTAR
jgi:hypothetical protein